MLNAYILVLVLLTPGHAPRVLAHEHPDAVSCLQEGLRWAQASQGQGWLRFNLCTPKGTEL